MRNKNWKKHRGKTTTINLLVENFYSPRCTLTVTYRLTNMGLQFHSFSPHPLLPPSQKGTARVARETCQSEGNEKHVERREPEGYSIAQSMPVRKIQRPHNLSGTCGWAFCACTKRQSKKKKIGRPRVTYC